MTFASSSSRVLLNGEPGTPFAHGKGLHQGDPVSPMLFILAIDPLQLMFRTASQAGILKPIRARPASCRVSLYADDAGIFANPVKEEIDAIARILACFGDASGLVTNVSKTEVFPIRCQDIDLPAILSAFPAKLASFPGRYLGLPLHTRWLRRVDLQPLLDKAMGRLPGWKGKNLARPGRVSLAKSVLCAIANHHLTALSLPTWAIQKLSKITRNFIWCGEDSENASGGHSLVNWKTVCRPKPMGGLGITDLERFGRALRLRWPWLMWTDPGRQWVGSAVPCDETDMALFRASTTISLGNGRKSLFWHDDWTGRGPLSRAFPELYKIATRKRRSVMRELQEENWIRSVARLSSPTHLQEFIALASVITQVALNPDQEDSITWRWTPNGIYSAASAYAAQFSGSYPRFSPAKIWEAHAEPKCKFFAWLVLHGKILTADMLAIRGWPHDPCCPLCLRAPETATHLCKDCLFAAAVWSHVQV